MMYLCVAIQPGIAQVNNEDILDSFMDSYKLGIKIIKGDYLWQTYIQCSFSFILYYRICVHCFLFFLADMPPLLSFTLDMNLMPEHLLHLCVEYKQKFSPFHQLDHVYNIYKVK